MQEGVAYATLETQGKERFQRLRDVLGVTSFGINFIRLQPGQRGRIHRHEKQEEVYLVLEGVLSLRTDAGERDLGKGEMARVAPASTFAASMSRSASGVGLSGCFSG